MKIIKEIIINTIQEYLNEQQHVNKTFLCVDIQPEYKNYITIGEETGDLNFIFSHIKNIYLIRIKEKIKRFLKILEPVSIIFIALSIGVIIFSIMLPIFKLGENIDI